MAAPLVLLAPHIAAAEDWMVSLAAGKIGGDLELAQRAQQAEIVTAPRQIGGGVVVEVLFKLEALRILMVHRAPLYGALIGAGFIGQGDVGQPVEPGRDQRGEGYDRGEGRMAV